MFLRFVPIRTLSVICLTLTLTVLVFADTIRLKDGSIIKGKIVSFDRGKFTVLIDEGSRQRSLNYSADEIVSIVFEPISNQTPVNTPANNPPGGNTVITVGQNKSPTATPKPAPPVIKTEPAAGSKPDGKATPITIRIPVLADNTANGWTNSGWVVRKGQKIKIKANGRVSLGNSRRTDASGISTLPDANKLIKDMPTGALIAVIGADNNDFIFVGQAYEFVAARDGDLFLGLNEGNLDDNSGSFDVTIEIDP